MKEWGVEVAVFTKKENFYKSKKIPIKKYKSGKYTLRLNFQSDYKSWYDNPIMASFLPYYIDEDGVRHEIYYDPEKKHKYYVELVYPYVKDEYTMKIEGTTMDVDF